MTNGGISLYTSSNIWGNDPQSEFATESAISANERSKFAHLLQMALKR